MKPPPSPAVADFVFVICAASVEELSYRPADIRAKAPARPRVGIQGMILDALDDGRLSVVEAGELLEMVQRRLRAAAVAPVTETTDTATKEG